MTKRKYKKLLSRSGIGGPVSVSGLLSVSVSGSLSVSGSMSGFWSFWSGRGSRSWSNL